MHNVINNFNEWIWNVNNILIVWRKTKFLEQKYWDFFFNHCSKCIMWNSQFNIYTFIELYYKYFQPNAFHIS